MIQTHTSEALLTENCDKFLEIVSIHLTQRPCILYITDDHNVTTLQEVVVSKRWAEAPGNTRTNLKVLPHSLAYTTCIVSMFICTLVFRVYSGTS